MKKLSLILISLISLQLPAKTLLFLGDSLTEGYGISKENAYPALVEKLIKEKLKKDVKIINGGVSGSTTSDGLARLNWYLKKKPKVLLLALGANDGLRGLKLTESQKNLQTMIDKAQKQGIKVLLAGMLMPPNYGAKYTSEFKSMYQKLKNKNKLKSMPFLLEGIAGKKEFNQSDGIHPNEKGHQIIAKKVYAFIKDEL